MTARRTAYCERICSTPRLNTITQPVPNFRSTQDAIEMTLSGKQPSMLPLERIVRRHESGGNRFASRTKTQEPSDLLRNIDNTLPERTFALPPASGVMLTVK